MSKGFYETKILMTNSEDFYNFLKFTLLFINSLTRIAILN